MITRQYVVRAVDKEACDSLDKELPIASTSPHIPDREVEVLNKRRTNPIMTDWRLTEEEALELQKDGRVKYVEQLHRMTYEADEFKYDTEGKAFFSGSDASMYEAIKDPTIDLRNYGKYLHSVGNGKLSIKNTLSGGELSKIEDDFDFPNVDFVGKPANKGYYTDRPYLQTADGSGVDILVIDTIIDGSHPEWNSKYGGSRLRKIDWFNYTDVEGEMPDNFYDHLEGESEHGTHVTSIAAGLKHGMANNANIYFLSLTRLFDQAHDEHDNGGIGLDKAFELAAAWCEQNKSGNPKVINCSFSVGADPKTHYNIKGGTYRGTPWVEPENNDNYQNPIGGWNEAEDNKHYDDLDATIHNSRGKRMIVNGNRMRQYKMNYGSAWGPIGKLSGSQIISATHLSEYPVYVLGYNIGIPIYNHVDYPLQYIADQVDRWTNAGAHCFISAANDGLTLAVESPEHATGERYTVDGEDPSADWDNSIYYYSKDYERLGIDGNPIVYRIEARPTEMAEAGWRKDEYRTNRPRQPYNSDVNLVGWLDLPTSWSVNDIVPAFHSNVGAAVSIWGFGTSIAAAVPQTSSSEGIYAEGSNHKIGLKSGTSMASPNVAAVAACILETNPDLTVAEMKQKLLDDSKATASGGRSTERALALANSQPLSLFTKTEGSQIYDFPQNGFIYTSPDYPTSGWTGPYYSTPKWDYNQGETRIAAFDDGRTKRLSISEKLLLSSQQYSASTLTSVKASIEFTETTDIVLQLVDSSGNNVSQAGLPVTFKTKRGTLTDVVYENGVYKATYTPESAAYAAQVEAYIFGNKIDSNLNFAIAGAAPPVITSSTSFGVDEGIPANSVVYTITSDYGNVFTLGGADASLLQVDASTGEVRIIASPVFATKSIYNFTVQTFAFGLQSSVVPVVMSIRDAIDPVITFSDYNADSYLDTTFGLTLNIEENTKEGEALFKVNVADESSSTISLEDDTQGFTLHSDNTVSIATLDYESGSIISNAIVVTDAAGNSASRDFIINVTNVDDNAPVFTNGSSHVLSPIPEHTGLNTVIYTATATDSIESTDGVVTYSYNAFQFNNYLDVDASTGEVTLTLEPEYDDLSDTQYNLILFVYATDASGNQNEQVIQIPISERDHTAPVITNGASVSGTIDENNAVDLVLHTVQVNESNCTFTKTGGQLLIDSTTGEISIPYSADADAGQTSAFINYEVADAAGNTTTGSYSLTINNVDDIPPVIAQGNQITVNLDENINYQTWSYQLSISDDSGGSTFCSKTAGDLNITTGGLITANVPFDYEVATSHYIEFNVSDLNNNVTQGRLDITVNDVDDFPIITSSSTGQNVDSGQGFSGTLYTVTADKACDFYFWDEAAGTTTGTKDFSGVTLYMNSTTGAVTVQVGDVFGAGTEFEYIVAAQAQDDDQISILTITHPYNVDYTGYLSPSFVGYTFSNGFYVRDIAEDTVVGSVLGSLRIDDDQGNDITSDCTITLVGVGDGLNHFTLNINNEIVLSDDSNLDFENYSYLNASVSITHPTAAGASGGLTDYRMLSHTITDVDEPPVFVGNASPNIPVASSGSIIYSSFTDFDDPDSSGGAFVFSIFDPDGNWGGPAFSINSQTGQVTANVAITETTIFRFKIRCTHQPSGLYVDQIYSPTYYTPVIDPTVFFKPFYTYRATAQNENYSVAEIDYDFGGSVDVIKRIFIRHKNTGSPQYQNDTCIGGVQILDSSGNLVQSLYSNVSDWSQVSPRLTNSTNPTDTAEIPIADMNNLTWSQIAVNGNSAGNWHFRNNTGSSGTGASVGGIHSMAMGYPFTAGNKTSSQSGQSQFVYREVSLSSLLNTYGYIRSKQITIPNQGKIQIAYHNMGSATIDLDETLSVGVG